MAIISRCWLPDFNGALASFPAPLMQSANPTAAQFSPLRPAAGISHLYHFTLTSNLWVCRMQWEIGSQWYWRGVGSYACSFPLLPQDPCPSWLWKPWPQCCPPRAGICSSPASCQPQVCLAGSCGLYEDVAYDGVLAETAVFRTKHASSNTVCFLQESLVSPITACRFPWPHPRVWNLNSLSLRCCRICSVCPCSMVNAAIKSPFWQQPSAFHMAPESDSWPSRLQQTWMNTFTLRCMPRKLQGSCLRSFQTSDASSSLSRLLCHAHAGAATGRVDSAWEAFSTTFLRWACDPHLLSVNRLPRFTSGSQTNEATPAATPGGSVDSTATAGAFEALLHSPLHRSASARSC